MKDKSAMHADHTSHVALQSSSRHYSQQDHHFVLDEKDHFHNTHIQPKPRYVINTTCLFKLEALSFDGQINPNYFSIRLQT